MKKIMLFTAAVALPTAAQAAQFVTTRDIVAGTPTIYGQLYTGPQLGLRGAAGDGGRDAFDTYGYYTSDAPGGLQLTRRAEAFADQNLYRWFDTFTNTTGATITTTVRFTGDLGSDSLTSIRASGAGFMVTCQFNGACSSDPVVAAVSSNIGFGTSGLTAGSHASNDRYFTDFALTVRPGESVGLLNFAFLASDNAGTNANDLALAIAKAQDLRTNPFVDGLTLAQQRTVVNFDLGLPPVQGVPEPATWAMMIGGFGLLGAAARRRNRIVAMSA
ncbi:hypothetical protein SCH01S_48_02310 [Sphingomonas changbaiensis NBRC 104936]|uniref:Ice-binding protein C-terminal domain-containing protein n=1 Tax=Sphingomonas changbaiensis NBRC 104936 TaxID=1219043 RepID=A0A0E9MSM3_9SPHN|nr:PEPxxWA-CTERM sorting domain-containing protein [Sphingomonas changbaiensis]GAO40569.1 hypothetical protein SCH01S_48_02310 [Sphingomonas changbaiensis NBRC 104936]